MIIDTLTNAEKYFGLHTGFKSAFEYLMAADLQALAPGTYEVDDDVKIFLTEKEGMTPAVASQKFECHNQNIDIQLCIRGNETLGWKPRADCAAPKGAYSEEKDVLFFEDAPDMYFSLKAGQFVIFYPEDVHAPMIAEGLIKKLVVKVRI